MLRTIIIDDDEIVTFLQRKIVSKTELDPDPYSFKDGQKALDFLAEEAGSDIDYLIMLDINMPKMDGWEFLRRLKEIPGNERFYVVMVTSSIDRKDKREAANDPHVVDFIEKPVSARHCSKLKGISKLSGYFEES
ncbi:response regulator [Christiangramia sabulilitoris]|nr:response regulator [Christiangramia sabulilitoris]